MSEQNFTISPKDMSEILRVAARKSESQFLGVDDTAKMRATPDSLFVC